MNVIRSFIAVDLSPEVQKELELLREQLMQQCKGLSVRWVEVKNIHVTLKFLGDVPESDLEKLFKIMQDAASRQPAFELGAVGLGAFPNIHHPRVIWVGVQASPGLAALQTWIDEDTDRLGYASEQRKFSPHLTLGRVGDHISPGDARRIGEILAQSKVGVLGRCFIDAVHYYRSDLYRDGPVYTRLFSAMLQNN